MIDIKPRELSSCRPRGSSFEALYLSRSTSLSPVSTMITCRYALGCVVAAGCGWRGGAAGDVCRCVSRVGSRGQDCSRSPHRGGPLSVACWLVRRVCPQEMVPVCVEVSPWAWWSEYRARNLRVGEQMVFAGVIDPLRVRPGGWDLGVDSLATQLVIDRRLAHGATPYGRVCGGGINMVCTDCEWAPDCVYRLWMGAEIVCTGCGWVR
jgi:hypothetical protein